MQIRLETFLDVLAAASDLSQLTEAIYFLRDQLGVCHVVYHSVNASGGQYAALTYSDLWVERYKAMDYARIDPVVQGCYQRFHPVDWKDLDWSGKAQRAFLAEAIAHDVGRQGFSVPIRGPNGQFAMFTVSDNRTDEDWAAYTAAHIRDLILVAHFVNQRALEIERGTDEVSFRNLSPREVDALTLLAMGYSRGQAAESLSISEHTLRVYIESARFKLGAMNTTHAVAKALSTGLVVI